MDEIVWVKMTVNRRLAKSHGFYLQHAKEVCLVGRRGRTPPGCASSVGSDVIFSERRGQSQKPEEVYELVEKLVPNGRGVGAVPWMHGMDTAFWGLWHGRLAARLAQSLLTRLLLVWLL